MTETLSKSDAIRRHALLVIALVMTVVGAVNSFGGDVQQETNFSAAVCMKVGIVLFMLWLALPQLLKLNFWAVLPVGGVALIAIFRPQLFLVGARVVVPLAPVLFLIWLIRQAKLPAKKRNKSTRDT